jgi:ADP-ribose pyrophosphatase YjhB (NUDIX family)
MIQRKDSISFMEFIKGKYELNNVIYLKKLLVNMTTYELAIIKKSTTFDDLWFLLWRDKAQRDYEISKRKYTQLLNGYNLVNKSTQEVSYITLSNVITDISNVKLEPDTEWEFPKGRRNINETDIHCAFREFQEETGINLSKVKLSYYFNKPHEELYISMNNVRYRHIYYITEYNDAKCISKSLYNPLNKMQIKEVKDAQWFTLTEALAKIKEVYIERKELIQRISKKLHSLQDTNTNTSNFIK